MDSYSKLLERISSKYGVSVEQLDKRVASRRAKLFGLIGKCATARTISAPLAVSSFLAAGARHVSGLHVTDALAAANKEARAGHISTFGYWPQPDESPAAIASHYIEAIDTISAANLESSISIKVDQLEFERGLILPVLRQARARKVRVHFDAQGFATIDQTLALVEEAHALGTDVSATLPSRFERSVSDAELLIRLGIPVRVVKGQGPDPNNPKLDPRRSFLYLVKHLSGRAAHVGVATHDRRVAEPALDMLLGTDTPCSLEQLRSLPRLDFLAEKRGIPVRVYVAYGRFGLPYAISEVIRRPAIVGWILRDALERLH